MEGTEEIFTDRSVEGLLSTVSALVLDRSQCFVRGEGWGERKGGPFTYLFTAVSPGIRCCVRVSQSKHLLVEFSQLPGLTEKAWARFLTAPTLDLYRGLWKIRKRVTLHISLIGAQYRNPTKVQHALRRSDTWRFRPEMPYPLVKHVSRLHQKGEHESANVLQALLDAPAVKTNIEKREASRWRTVWIHPAKQTVEDVYFLLLLMLLQEELFDLNDAVRETACRYLCDRFASIPDRYWAESVLYELQRRFTEPEDWRALRGCVSSIVKLLDIPKFVKTHGGNERQQIGEYKLISVPNDETAKIYRKKRMNRDNPRTDPPRYPVSEVIARLQLAEPPVSRDSLYDWIDAGRVPVHRKGRRMWLDEDGLTKARELEKLRFYRGRLKCLLEKEGKNSEAIKKYMQRHRLTTVKALEEELRKRIGRSSGIG